MSKIYHNIGAPEGHLTYTYPIAGGMYRCECKLKFKTRDALVAHVKLMKMLQEGK